jgi:hypothetical protein
MVQPVNRNDQEPQTLYNNIETYPSLCDVAYMLNTSEPHGSYDQLTEHC